MDPKNTFIPIGKTMMNKKSPSSSSPNPSDENIRHASQIRNSSSKKKASPKSSSQRTAGDNNLKENQAGGSNASAPAIRKPLLRRRRKEKTRTISQIQYRIAQSRYFHKNLIRGVFLLIPIMLIVAGVAVIFQSNPKVLLILHSVDQGFAALEENRSDEASILFQKALNAYNTYHIQHPGLWWKRDAKIFISMLKSTQGWRKLENFRQGLLAFESIAAHNSEGLNSWVGVQMESDMMDFIHSSHWTDEQIASMYSFIQKLPLDRWGDHALLLIRTSERVGLNAAPMKARLENLDFLIYGTPKPMTTKDDDQLIVDAIRYYYIERETASESIALPNNLPSYVRERLFWYSRANRECLIFVNNPDRPTIQSLNDILLSENRSVEEFNRYYRE